MDADGTGQTRLTNNKADDVYPAWSPDGSRIAFQAYRDGQAEIYVMNADGSGVTRLSNYADYDGQPAWAPDSTKIAFVRRVDGKYRIWVMNADGSDPRQYSNQPSSENPVWSSDGSQIAYDADGNSDSWQEIWLMDAAGGNQRAVYQPGEPNTDAWVHSWSPDGRFVTFTRISFIQQGGNWYWTTAYLDACDSANPGSLIRLSSAGMDWNPDWQSTDLQAPTSSMQPLPPQSPGPFTVSWSGTDAGPAGLAGFNVQVKDGSSGAWTDWQVKTPDLSATYPGIGGHTYYFRARARDNAGNVEAWPADYDVATTVEALPPRTSIEPLPPYSHSPILVRWGGSDPGGSGIQRYEVQFRVNNGTWTNWPMDTTDTSALFSEWPGRECSFRVRGIDNAQNEEAWPVSGADATTVTYTWAVAGDATDNRGAPVAGMTVTTAPAALHAASSDDAGAYAAYVADGTDAYIVNWSKAGYGSLPPTALRGGEDAHVDLVLPPTDNVVPNWGFESGSDSWQFAGGLTGTITNSVKHSGASAVFLGSGSGPFRSVTILTDQVRSAVMDFAVDAAGIIHGIWIGLNGHVMYSKKPPTGSWTVPAALPDPAGDQPRLLVDRAGTVHVLWLSDAVPRGLYYSRRQSGAGWSAPERIPGSDSAVYRPGLAMGAAGVVKVVWAGEGSGSSGTIYAQYLSQRDPSGVWTPPRKLSADDAIPWTMIATDPAGRAHVLWWNRDEQGNVNVFYTSETADGRGCRP